MIATSLNELRNIVPVEKLEESIALRKLRAREGKYDPRYHMNLLITKIPPPRVYSSESEKDAHMRNKQETAKLARFVSHLSLKQKIQHRLYDQDAHIMQMQGNVFRSKIANTKPIVRTSSDVRPLTAPSEMLPRRKKESGVDKEMRASLKPRPMTTLGIATSSYPQVHADGRRRNSTSAPKPDMKQDDASLELNRGVSGGKSAPPKIEEYHSHVSSSPTSHGSGAPHAFSSVKSDLVTIPEGSQSTSKQTTPPGGLSVVSKVDGFSENSSMRSFKTSKNGDVMPSDTFSTMKSEEGSSTVDYNNKIERATYFTMENKDGAQQPLSYENKDRGEGRHVSIKQDDAKYHADPTIENMKIFEAEQERLRMENEDNFWLFQLDEALARSSLRSVTPPQKSKKRKPIVTDAMKIKKYLKKMAEERAKPIPEEFDYSTIIVKNKDSYERAQAKVAEFIQRLDKEAQQKVAVERERMRKKSAIPSFNF